jgi:hypothetical protein
MAGADQARGGDGDDTVIRGLRLTARILGLSPNFRRRAGRSGGPCTWG